MEVAVELGFVDTAEPPSPLVLFVLAVLPSDLRHSSDIRSQRLALLKELSPVAHLSDGAAGLNERTEAVVLV